MRDSARHPHRSIPKWLLALIAIPVLLLSLAILSGVNNRRDPETSRMASMDFMSRTFQVAVARTTQTGEEPPIRVPARLRSDFIWAWPVDESGIARAAVPQTVAVTFPGYIIWEDASHEAGMTFPEIKEENRQPLRSSLVADSLLAPIIAHQERLGRLSRDPKRVLEDVSLRPVRKSVEGLAQTYGPIEYRRNWLGSVICVEFIYEGTRERYCSHCGATEALLGIQGFASQHQSIPDTGSLDRVSEQVWFTLTPATFDDYVEPDIQ